jgi:DNA-binding response OmpR family regulator/glycine cleavage system H lipoate-binding protein
MLDEPRLLVVDDEEVICVGCQRIFSRQGFRVDESTDPLRGLSMATEEDYSAILLDVKMRPMDGIQFLEKLRESKPDVPVVLITGYAGVANAASAVRLGASDYVTKPFTPEEITQSVQRAIAKRAAAASEKAVSASASIEFWPLRAGEFRFWQESWLQLASGASVLAGAMHQRMPAPPTPFEGSMRVGVVLRPSLAAAVEAIRLPRAGEMVCQGWTLAGLTLAGQPSRDVPSPISGVVTAVNRRLEKDPWALKDDPCGKGWIACLSPTRFEHDVSKCRPRRLVLANADEVSARRQHERLKSLGCDVRVAKDGSELRQAVRDTSRTVLLLDSASFGERGPGLVQRVHAAVPAMTIVVSGPRDPQCEASYQGQPIFRFTTRAFDGGEVVEILDAVFRTNLEPDTQGNQRRG